MNNNNNNNNNNNEMKKEKLQSFILGAVVGGTIVACIKDDSDTLKEITASITKIATSYYGCKFIYSLFS